ncbi:hypothetical protein PRZ48_013677 [Zasmidium cellare]|uniref:Major facilitator superfamily (MFS) profile domain-containing protein n=1 Tax=Zasmidium cellare TaxID=395010 RepID=A0ABR0E1P9_ZASCE|nr:hypothetical protein PRZ48_013677 [Zasmidium cellare]
MSSRKATEAVGQEKPEHHPNTSGYYLDRYHDDGDGKTAADGQTILIPQPTEDPNDPLNWPPRKKNLILLIITYLAFLPDFGSALGAHNLVGNLFCLGTGSLFTVFLSAYFGRLPILFLWQLMALGTGIWCAAAQSFPSFLGARIVVGFFAIAAQAGGLMWIDDMFFFHERPRKINTWSGGIIISPYLGPFVAAFVVWRGSWRWCYWIYSILSAVGLVLILLIDETYYDRSLPREEQPVWKSRVRRLLGLERHPQGSFLRSVSRPFVAICKVPVALITVYYFLNFAWIIGVNVTISTWLTSFYGFSPKSLGLFYFSGITGSILGEVLGHWAHDSIGNFYSRRHGGRIDSEARLIMCYPAGVLMVVGLLILGFALQYHWHWAYLAVFGAMQITGINFATTAINAYLLDSYPEGSGEVGAWIVVGRTLGGFMATFIEIPWVTGSDAAKVLGVQTGITAAAMLIPLFLQVFGKRVRQFQGPMRFPDMSKSA